MAKKMPKTYKGKSTRPGGGGRWARLRAKGVPAGVLAKAGRKKYGKKKMGRWSAKGRKRAARRRQHGRMFKS